MATDEADDFDYTAAAVRVLREAGTPLSDRQFWSALMRAEGIPESDRELYGTGPFEPRPSPHNFVKLKITTSFKTDMGLDGVLDTELQSTGDGYWLREWGPLPEKEQQRRAAIRTKWQTEGAARPTTDPAPRPISSMGPKQGGGCYIATAVYGSYEAPQVLVLRRFRDEQLARSASGRLFIRFYYRVSPSLSARFGQGTPLNRLAKPALDAIVERLADRPVLRN